VKQIVPVIILNWNGFNDTVKAIKSILNQSYKNFHLYVADNDSANQEGEQLKQFVQSYQNITFVQFNDNLGFTEAHNRIFRKYIINNPNYEYVLLLNNDAFAEPDWIGNLLKTANNTTAGMIASKMIQYFNKHLLDNAGHMILNTAEIIPFGHGAKAEKFNLSFENFGACGGACLYNIEMLKDIGLFDNNFTTGYEDAELGARAIVCGYTCLYEPSAIVFHKGSQSLKKIMNEEYLTQIQRNIFYTYFKLMPTMVILLNMPIIIFKYGLVLLIDILFRRRIYFKIMWNAIKYTITKDRKKIILARKQFRQNHQHIASFEIIKKMTFFLVFDVKRFFKYIVFRNNHPVLNKEIEV